MSPRGEMRTLTLRLCCISAVTGALLLSGCAKRKRVSVPATPGLGWTEVGVASWYGHPYHGRRAANGEIYDMERLTAAHRTLPFGAQVRVLNLENRRTVQVRINDRGPFVEGRVIDLSRAAARRIHMLGPGTTRVRLEVLSLPASSSGCCYAVQIGAFRERANAERQQRAAERLRHPARLQWRDGEPPLWRVLVGQEATSEEAAALARQLRTHFDQAFVVRLDPPSPPL